MNLPLVTVYMLPIKQRIAEREPMGTMLCPAMRGMFTAAVNSSMIGRCV